MGVGGKIMSFETYWGNKLLKNVGLIEGEKITLSIECFKTEIEKAYRAGQREGLDIPKKNSPFDEIFKGHPFGK
jgi:predicted DNA-binding antitoxin AbrB/MazE fold protein